MFEGDIAPERTRRELILDAADDLMLNFMVYNRDEDESLPRLAIEEAIATGEITVDEILERFRIALLSQ